MIDKQKIINIILTILSIVTFVLSIFMILIDFGSAMYTGFGLVNFAGLIFGIFSILLSVYFIRTYVLTGRYSNDKI